MIKQRDGAARRLAENQARNIEAYWLAQGRDDVEVWVETKKLNCTAVKAVLYCVRSNLVLTASPPR
jgi:hypothetical protein